MENEKQKMIASVVKAKRTDLNYTQQELADLCKVSLRSTQRIENGEVYPRQYTLNELSKNLNFSLDILKAKGNVNQITPKSDLAKKRIMSLTLILGTILLSTAFVAQSSNFPETNFELYLFYTAILGFLSLGLLFLLRKKN